MTTMRVRHLSAYWAAAVVAVALPSCAGPQAPATPALLDPRAVPARRIVVQPGESIQTAVDAARPGDAIVVEPGTYREAGRACPFDTSQTCAVSVTTDDIALTARGGKETVVLKNARGLTNGIAIGKSSDCSGGRVRGSRVEGFVVSGFTGSGIALQCVEGWELAYNSARKNLLYGLSVSFSGNGRLHDNVASDAHRTGIRVAMSRDIRIDRNVVHDNVVGLEVREMERALVEENTATGNTAGIFESIMPGDPIERSRDNTLRNNIVQRNNRANKCSEPSDPVCRVAPGVGIAVIGGHANVNAGNRVIGNRTFGIAVLDVCSAFKIPESQCGQLDFNPLPEGIRSTRNIVLQNATDLLWTNNGVGNCWSRNRARVRVPGKLPHC